jgi:hypothetical protein
MMDWQGLIQFLGGSVVFSAAFGYIGKSAVDAYLNGRIEEHKADLQRLATEHSVRFQRLHAERADIIKDLYARLAMLDDALASALASFQHAGEMPLTEKVKELSKLYNDLREYYVPKRIFFPQSVCSNVDTILAHFRDIFYDITTYPIDPTSADYQSDRDALMERRNFWEKARGMHKNEFTAAKSALEASFRENLGIGA